MNSTRSIRHFYRNPENAFKDGFSLRRKSKRVNDGMYWKYHYFVPSTVMPVIRFLKGYFEILDSISDIPVTQRFRNSKMEYATTAAEVLFEVRNRLICDDEMVLGSEFLSPCPWAIIGQNRKSRLSRKEFRSMRQIFTHYEPQFLQCRGYNCAVILHRQDEVFNRLAVLAQKERKSVNVILTVALLLLHDIIKNCGPDCKELKRLFTNDRRATHNEATFTWSQACVKDKTPSGQAWSISRDRACYEVSLPKRAVSKTYIAPPLSSKYNHRDYMRDFYGHFSDYRPAPPAFSDVEFVDLGFTALVTDEKTLNFGEFKTISKGGCCGIQIEDIDEPVLVGEEHLKMLEGWIGNS